MRKRVSYLFKDIFAYQTHTIVKHTHSFVLTLICLLISSAGCKHAITTPLPVSLLIVNASPDAPGIDVIGNNSVLAQDLTYGNDTGYFSLTTGVYELKAGTTGATDYFFDNILSLASNKYYTCFLIDSLSKIQTIFVEDKFSAANGDSAKLRYLDFSPDAPTLYANFINATDTVIYASRSFNDQLTNNSKSAFTQIKAGTYSLQLTATDSTAAVKTLDSVILSAGKVYTVYLKGFYEGTGTQTLSTGTIEHLQ